MERKLKGERTLKEWVTGTSEAEEYGEVGHME